MPPIKIVISAGLTLKNVPDKIKHKIKSELTVINPVWASAKKRGSAHLMRITEQFLYFFSEHSENILLTPRGYLDRVLEHVEGLDYETIDRTVKPSMTDPIKFTGEARDYQEAAIDDILPRRYGVLHANTGAGKTFAGVAVTAERGVKTLVVVHNKELQSQWVESFKRFTTIKKVGQIGGSKCDIQDVTVAIINTASKLAVDLRDTFGMLICDETHRVLSPTWMTLINTIKPYYQLGLTATPFRNDGTTKALFAVIGPKLHEVSKQKLTDSGAVLVPDVFRVPTPFRYEYNDDYAKMLSTLTEDRQRNYLIANYVTQDLLKYRESVLVVSDRVAHCDVLAEIITEQCPIAKTVVVSSKLNRDAREAVIAGMRTGVYNVMLATVSLVGEGFDLDSLNCLCLTTPIRFSGRLLQVVGRVLRPSISNAAPRVFDFRDNFVNVFRNTGFVRDKEFVKNKWNICQ